MSVTINTLEIENVKKVKAGKIVLPSKGLFVIGGKNRAGKTTFTDAIAWLLGGEKFRPSNPNREGSEEPAYLKTTLSNGLIVERKGKNGSLMVTDPEGKKAGQTLINEFLTSFALDLPEFLHASMKKKAEILLQIIGVGDQLQKLEEKEAKLYAEREAFGRVADQKKKYAEELPMHDDSPAELTSASDLIKKQQAILLKNAENEKARGSIGEIQEKAGQALANIQTAETLMAEKLKRIEELQSEIKDLVARKTEEQEAVKRHEAALIEAKKTVEQLKDESTAEIEAQLNDIETMNNKIRANQTKAAAKVEAEKATTEYAEMGKNIAEARNERKALLEGAALPLPGLTVEGGELIYNGQKWDCMSGAEQMIVATSIVRKLNPECGFVLIDKLEQMDLDTLSAFAEWLESEGLQGIGARVTTGDESSVIIEDGEITVDLICPLQGQFLGKPWTEVPADALKWALDNKPDGLTPAHVAGINRVLRNK